MSEFIKKIFGKLVIGGKKIDVLIIEDHLLVAEAWQTILNSHEDFGAVLTCCSAEEGLAILENFKPEIILLDINLPHSNGIEAIPGILRLSPDSRIIGLSIHADPALVKQMMLKGASGYLTKSSGSQEFFEAIQQVLTGKKYICTEIRDALAENLFQSAKLPATNISKLTKRERELIANIKVGLSLGEAAQKMGINIRTARAHQYNILRKLEIRSARDLFSFVEKNSPLF